MSMRREGGFKVNLKDMIKKLRCQHRRLIGSSVDGAWWSIGGRGRGVAQATLIICRDCGKTWVEDNLPE